MKDTYLSRAKEMVGQEGTADIHDHGSVSYIKVKIIAILWFLDLMTVI